MENWDSPPRILIIDDETAMTQALARMLEMMGYRPSVASSGERALELMRREQFDLALLDLRMPGLDGLAVLDRAQSLAPGTIFVILTAHGSLDSAITALRHGAFDYLLKPCSVDDIVEAIRRGLLERQKVRHRERLVGLLREAIGQVQTEEKSPPAPVEAPSRLLTMGSIRLDPQWQVAIVNGERIHLSNTEYTIMAYFAEHLNQAVSCSQLVLHTHGQRVSEQEARPIIRMHIHRLRQKLEPDPSTPRYLRTVRGVGYMFVSSAPPNVA